MYVKEPFEVQTKTGSVTVYQGAALEGYFAGGGWLVRKKFRLAPDKKLYDMGISGVPMGVLRSGGDASVPDTLEIQTVLESRKLAESFGESVGDLEDLYFERCGTCHRAYEPETYSYPRWQTIVDSMKVHAGMNEKTTQKILRYLILSAAAD